jgi:hypothetical protein
LTIGGSRHGGYNGTDLRFKAHVQHSIGLEISK